VSAGQSISFPARQKFEARLETRDRAYSGFQKNSAVKDHFMEAKTVTIDYINKSLNIW